MKISRNTITFKYAVLKTFNLRSLNQRRKKREKISVQYSYSSSKTPHQHSSFFHILNNNKKREKERKRRREKYFNNKRKETEKMNIKQTNFIVYTSLACLVYTQTNRRMHALPIQTKTHTDREFRFKSPTTIETKSQHCAHFFFIFFFFFFLFL